ncbi:MAG: hypothetical protein U0457_03935 [Candidatus Sericytochromatia bacterium]
MFAINILFQILILPLIIASIILFIAWKPLKKEDSAIAEGFWSFPLSIGLAFFISYWNMLGLPEMPPNESTQWLIFIALFSIIIGLIDGYIKLPKIINYIIKFLSVIGVSYISLFQLIKGSWETNQSATNLGIVSVLGFIFYFLYEKNSNLKLAEEKEDVFSPIINTGLFIGGTAVLSLISSSLALAKFSGILGSIFIPLFLIALLKPTFSLKKSFSVISLMFIAIYINIWYFSYVKSTAGFFVLALAPLIPLVSNLSFFKKFSTIKIILIRAVLAIIPIILALLLSYDFNKKEDDYYGYLEQKQASIYNHQQYL